MADTKAQAKVLFVGSERICRQVAYVLDLKDYALAEKLTAANFDQYRDCQIYVCEFKKKSGKYVDRKISKVASNIQYMDDICRAIDEEYYANRGRHKNDLNAKKTKSVAAKNIEQIAKNVAKNSDQEPSIKPSLISRIRRGMKHPLRAAWHVVLRLQMRAKQAAKRRYEQKQIRKSNPKYLRKYLCGLCPSELLLYVLRAPVKENIQCTLLETDARVEADELSGCCGVMVPYGNLLTDGELDEIYNSTYARIVKLSSLNRSYCLCNFNGWCNGYCSSDKTLPVEQWETSTLPKGIFLSFDHTCNLCCRACRKQPYIMDEITREHLDFMTAKLLRSGWLEQIKKLELAGSGEVFYSPYYRQLITTDLKRQQINIKSNGTLFNQENWQLLADKYSTINVNISVDAATAETYQKLRGADFNHLKKNLTMIGNLRRQGRIRSFMLNFVVQRDNFREMADFVRLGRTLGADRINFQRIRNFGSFTAQEYLERCLIIDKKYLDYELWCVLQDPIFKDPYVNLKPLQRYIDASERKYRKRYEREQQGRSA